MPNLKLGDVVPNFDADTTEGKINFHEWIGDSWAVLFSHPADYTPVCTTELGRVQKLSGEFQKRGIKLTALSCDSVESHKGMDDITMEKSDSYIIQSFDRLDRGHQSLQQVGCLLLSHHCRSGPLNCQHLWYDGS